MPETLRPVYRPGSLQKWSPCQDILSGRVLAQDEIAARTPLRAVGQPEDIADVIVFLASAQSRWVTGQLIYVGGGWRMHQ